MKFSLDCDYSDISCIPEIIDFGDNFIILIIQCNNK